MYRNLNCVNHQISVRIKFKTVVVNVHALHTLRLSKQITNVRTVGDNMTDDQPDECVQTSAAKAPVRICDYNHM